MGLAGATWIRLLYLYNGNEFCSIPIGPMSDSADKPVILTGHAKDRLLLRGATVEEVIKAVREGQWQLAKRGKWHAARQFEFGGISPVNGLRYNFKTVDAVFADEPDRLVVLTVKVFYHD